MVRIASNLVKIPRRQKDARKGQHGRLLIVGGSEEFVGAPILAAKAAFRAGVDIVEVAAPSKEKSSHASQTRHSRCYLRNRNVRLCRDWRVQRPWINTNPPRRGRRGYPNRG